MPCNRADIKRRNNEFGLSRSIRLDFLSPMSLTLNLQATPNAPRSEIIGWMGDRLKLKIKAPAVEGKANAELLRFLAKVFGVRPNAVTLLRGETARLKVVRIEGAEEADLQRVCPR